MPSKHDTLMGGLDFISALDRAANTRVTNDREASRLENRAKALRAAGPKGLDEAIHAATANLMALGQAGELSNEAILMGVLRTNQHKPSRTIWNGPAAIEPTMEWFHAIQPGAPMIKWYGDDFVDTYIIAGGPIAIDVSVAQGMGGLPQANVRYGAHQVAEPHQEGVVNTADEATPFEVRVPNSHKEIIIGSAAIQRVFDVQEFYSSQYTCGHSEHTNSNKLHALSAAASRLTAVGFEFDTTHLNTVLTKAETYAARRQAYEDSRREYVEDMEDMEDELQLIEFDSA